MSPSYHNQRYHSLIFLGIGIVIGVLIGQFAGLAKNIAHWSTGNVSGPATFTAQTANSFRIGYLRTPLLAPLFAVAQEDKGVHFHLVPFADNDELGVALTIGEVDAAFIDTTIVNDLLTHHNAKQPDLRVAGSIEFPYGATLVVRKDFKNRLTELAGTTIGAGEPTCSLLRTLQHDATRLGADLSKVHFTYMEDNNLVPALIAGKIDGAVVKSDVAMLAVASGGKVLYQNWSVQSGINCGCCPLWARVTDSLLIVAPGHAAAVADLTHRLEQVSKKDSREDLNNAVVNFINFPVKALDGNWPSARYAPLNKDAHQHFATHLWSNQ